MHSHSTPVKTVCYSKVMAKRKKTKNQVVWMVVLKCDVVVREKGNWGVRENMGEQG